MNSALYDLNAFVQKQCKNNGEFINFIKNHRINRVFIDKLKEMNMKEYEETKKAIKSQKEFNSIREVELKKISKAFYDNGVKLIHIKGQYLAADLYEFMEQRKSLDIDLLIDSDNIELALNILDSLGYVTHAYDILDNNSNYKKYDIDKAIKGLARCYHLSELGKKIEVNDNKSITMEMDLHVRIINNYAENWSYMKSVIARAIEANLQGNNIWLLEIHDRIINLMSHFTEEYIQKDMNALLLYNKNYYTDISKLHDIALLIDKNEIDWNLVYARSVDWDADGDVLFACKLINMIYPERIPTWILNKEYTGYELINKETKFNSIMKRALPILLKEDVLNLICFDSNQKFRKILGNIFWMGPSAKCLRHEEKDRNDNASKITIDENIVAKQNVFDTHVKLGNCTFAKNFTVDNSLWWDESYLYISTTIKSLKSLNLNDFMQKSGIRIDIGTGEDANKLPFLRNFIFQVREEINSSVLYWRKYYIWDGISSVYPYPYKIYFSDDLCQLSIAIPWKFLSVVPYKDMALWLDITAVIFSSRDDKQFCWLTWANSAAFSQSYDDITYLGKVKLE